MFAPILRLHRLTIEQMAILEPAVVESTMATCITVLREAMEAAVEKGVPKQAAYDFCLGHIRTELAIVFKFAEFPFSDGAIKAIEQNKPRIFREDWKNVITIPALQRRSANLRKPDFFPEDNEPPLRLARDLCRLGRIGVGSWTFPASAL
jgi:hypothetical protein